MLNRSHIDSGVKGRITGIQIGDIKSYTYGYDSCGRLNRITSPAGSFIFARLADSDLARYTLAIECCCNDKRKLNKVQFTKIIFR